MGSFGETGYGAARGRGDSCGAQTQGPDTSRYVRAADGGLVDVSDVDPGDRYARGPYTCLACEHVMVPALGRTRKHHFKHKAGRPVGCFDETYIHQLAKLTLFSSLEEAMRTGVPYWLTRERQAICDRYKEEFGFSCTAQSAAFSINLAERFDRVELEAGAEGFVADILLSSSVSKDRLLLEVAVTHPCEEEKISSGLPIIELNLRSEEAARQLAHGIDARSPMTICHNLPAPEPAPHRCSAPCPTTGLALLLYDDGKAWYSEVDLGHQDGLLSDRRLVAHEIVEPRPGRHSWEWREARLPLRDFMIRQRFEEGRHVRSCLMCWNNGGRLNQHDIRCLAKERRVWMSSSASSCPDYDEASDSEEVARIFDEQLR